MMADGSPSTLREELLSLDAQRLTIVQAMEEAMAFLDTTPVGMHAPLVDEEGFPRDDCDLYAVRKARHTVNCGKNDLKSIETAMHEKLALLHEKNQEEAKQQMQQAGKKSEEDEKDQQEKKRKIEEEERKKRIREISGKTPFVRVVSVAMGSPGAEAGLTAGDLILQYGSLDAAGISLHGWEEMGRVTSTHEGQMLTVWIRREEGEEQGEENVVNEARELFIVPQRWAGGGLLGCAFEPCIPDPSA
ncbi:putative proteasome 26S non-ATPase subunit 9 [Trypanosoma theileri]|uniref:Putative proteasome 26S non-ATPase subunit 9 n=1 Tax=Trypanosoma theileri TaxID=67003 RepID=A0A1X0NG23_9TRYP|nr:putative proteasome 26S non-ATPase subunit 9 [Trypanosoma theileri]ORC83607.1 putative proteasome 26S non-ATPase subunit 9 [Trypanosoma theileri]